MLFSYDFESAEEKKKDWIDFFLVRRAEKGFLSDFFREILGQNDQYDFHKCDFFCSGIDLRNLFGFDSIFYITTDFSFPSTILVMKL